MKIKDEDIPQSGIKFELIPIWFSSEKTPLVQFRISEIQENRVFNSLTFEGDADFCKGLIFEMHSCLKVLEENTND